MYVTKLSYTCRKRIKGKRKQKLDTRKVKKNKTNIIIYTVIYLPDNGAKNLTQLKD